MTRKYGIKCDANHKDLVNCLRKLGADVLDISTVGCGVPDLVVWCRGNWHLVDIKNPNTGYGKRGLNKNQKQWAAHWKGGPVYMIYSTDDAIALVNGDMENLKCEGLQHNGKALA